MQLVLVSSIFPPDIGGPATHVADLRDELESRRHNITVLSLHDGRRTLRNPGLVRFPRWWPSPFRHIAVAAWLFRHRSEYESVYAAGLHPSAVLAARLSRHPVVVRVAGDPVWERARRLHRTSATFDEFQRSDQMSMRDGTVRRIRDWALTRASAIVTPNEYLADVVRRWLKGSGQVEVVPNGVRAPAHTPQRRRGRDETLRAIWIGRIIRTKNLDRVLEAVARAPNVTLEVIGDGPEKRALEARTKQLRVADRVTFLGPLVHSDVLKHLADAHVLVNASDYEGLPHTFIEALCCGTPVVGPALGGVQEMIGSGAEAIIQAPPTAAGLAAALSTLRDHPARLEELSAAALSSSEQWTFDRTAEAVERVIEGITLKPAAIFTGKGALAGPPEELDAKFRILAEHFHPVLLTIGKPAEIPERSEVISVPRARPKFVEHVLFYGLGAILSMVRAVRTRPSVVFAQDPFSALGPILLSRALPQRLRPVVVVGAHGDWHASMRLYGGISRRLLAPMLDRIANWAVRRASIVRVVSESLESLVRSAGYQGPIVRYTGYSSFASFLDAPVPLPDSPQACFVGTLEDPKGVDVLLRAWTRVEKEIAGARLVLVGDGRLDRKMHDLSASQGHRGVRFLGRVSRRDVKTVLDTSTCLVLPSRSEGLPRIIQEASARARPAVATTVGGIPELVTPGTTGFLVPPEDEEQLAEALICVLRNRQEATALGQAARERVENRNLPAEYAQGVAELASIAARGPAERRSMAPQDPK